MIYRRRGRDLRADEKFFRRMQNIFHFLLANLEAICYITEVVKIDVPLLPLRRNQPWKKQVLRTSKYKGGHTNERYH